MAHLNEQDAARFPARLWAMPQVDLALEEKGEAARLLAALLPPVDSKPPDTEAKSGFLPMGDQRELASQAGRVIDRGYATLVQTRDGRVWKPSAGQECTEDESHCEWYSQS